MFRRRFLNNTPAPVKSSYTLTRMYSAKQVRWMVHLIQLNEVAIFQQYKERKLHKVEQFYSIIVMLFAVI